MKKVRIQTWLGVILLGSSLGLAACGGGQAGTPEAAAPKAGAPTPDSGSKAAATPAVRMFKDDYGREVKLEGTPKRVLAVYMEDPIVSLGVKPLLQFNFNGAGGASYLQKYLSDVPPAGTGAVALTPEQALSVNPDIIIAHNLVIGADKIESYAKIAPTYGLDANKSNWRAILLKVGELLNLSDKAEQVLKDYDVRAASAKEQLKKAAGSGTFALLRLTGKEYRLYGAGELDPFNGEFLYKELGLTPSKLVKDVPQAGGWSLSMEKLPELDADHLILVTNDAGKDQLQQLRSSSLWQNLPAVKNNHVYEVDPTMWLSIGNMANRAKIDDLLQRVVK
ncbi:MAG: periplasmic binding protein [Paenibacillus sp.]|jgi:iron complex transport system substrate-binding protein|nr:periplasmic binding protein [Paenibacillus sp.]